MYDDTWTTPLGIAGRHELLLTVFNKQDGICFHCQLPIFTDKYAAGAQKQNQATVEHLVPVSFGGCSCPANLVVACYRCNSARGRIPIAVFQNLLKVVFETPRFKAAWHSDSPESRKTLKRVMRVFAKANNMHVPPTLTWPSSPR
jgi:HNH endonuclease